LVREAGESKISMMEEMKIQEARERREAINREERKVKESIDRYKLMREAMAKMLREERIQNEREKTKETDELLKVYQERE
jgi:ABC-type transporter lipoprotein component MlaA